MCHCLWKYLLWCFSKESDWKLWSTCTLEKYFYFSIQISKMIKKSNLICVFISLLPIIVLFFYYNSLGQFTNTKISGSNGMIISRSSFIFVIVGLSVLWYYVSILISQRLIGLNSLISQVSLRSLINLFFSVLSILLILSNLRSGVSLGGWNKIVYNSSIAAI